MTFTPIIAGNEHVAVCPSCKQWLWKIGPNSGYFGQTQITIETAGDYLSSDGDRVRMDKAPAPLTSGAEYDAQLNLGECPHCGKLYWFVTVAYPEIPVANDQSFFICDEGYIDIAEEVEGTMTGDQSIVSGWTVLHQLGLWQGIQVHIDIHIAGPFSGGKTLVGPYGVSSCYGGGVGKNNIWMKAAKIVQTITPYAINHLRHRLTG